MDPYASGQGPYAVGGGYGAQQAMGGGDRGYQNYNSGYNPSGSGGGGGPQASVGGNPYDMGVGGTGAGPGQAFAKEAGNLLGTSFSPLAKTAVAAYGEKAQQFMQSRMNFFSGPLTKTLQYYFNVNTKYVVNKMRLLLCPFIHKGSWTRIPEQVPGGFQFKPPRHDLNAPDLYIPAMAFNTYCVLSSLIYAFSTSTAPDPGSGASLSQFSPERFGQLVWFGLFAWAAEVCLLKTATWVLNSSQQSAIGVPFFDLCAYGGDIFVHVTAQVLVGMFAGHWGYYVALAWGTLCMGVFLVKTLKRILYSQTRQASKQHSKRQSYMLLGIAMAQLPLAYWLGKVQ